MLKCNTQSRHVQQFQVPALITYTGRVYGASLKAILLLCVTHESVTNLSLVLTHGIYLAPLTYCIIGCFRPGEYSSIERYFKGGYNSADCLNRTAQYPFTFLFTSFPQHSFFIGLSNKAQQEGSHFTRIFLTTMYQLQISEPLTASCLLASCFSSSLHILP